MRLAADRLASFLSVLQLSDSAFPTGRELLSHGLEALVRSGRLATPAPRAALTALLRDYLHVAVGPSDGVGLACAHRATSTPDSLDLELITSVDEWLTAGKIARESREVSVRTGRALLGTATVVFAATAVSDFAHHVRGGHSPGNHAVVSGVVSACLGVPRLEAVTGELFAFCASWVAAAVRLAATDRTTAQAVLHDVRPALAEVALRAVDKDVADIGGGAPLLDVMAMRHEQAEPRLFAS